MAGSNRSAKLFALTVAALANIVLITGPANAVDLFSSGTKTWDNATQNWGAATGGPYNTTVWSSGTPDNAIFEGTAGTVSIAAGGVTAHDIDFNTNNYLIQNNTLTLAGATPTITTAPGFTATITSVIDGTSGLRKEGTGRLYLLPGGNPTNALPNTFSGDAVLAEGILQFGSKGTNPVGTGAFSIEGGTFIEVNGNNIQTLNNSQYKLNGDFSVTSTGGHTLNFFTGNVTLGADVKASVVNGSRDMLLHINGVIDDGGNSYGLTKDGTGTMYLSNEASTYTGKTVVMDGTLHAKKIANGGATSSLGAATGADAVIDIHNGAKLRAGRPTGNSNVTDRGINLAGTGPGTVEIFISDNDTNLTLNSDFTATGTGAKTLAFGINAGQTSGDRSDIIVNGAIPDVSDGSSLSVQITAEGSQQTKGVVLNGINTYTGDTTVRSGGVHATAVAGPGLTLGDGAGLLFEIGASGVNNQIRGIGFSGNPTGAGSNIIFLDGDFTFDLTNAGTELGDSWNIVDIASLTETFGPNFTVNDFMDIGSDQWEFFDGRGPTYNFSESTGVLSVTAAAVPEPAAIAIWTLLGLALSAFGYFRSRRGK